MGEPKHDGLAIPGRVVLAHERPFTIGRVAVDPPMRQLSARGFSDTVEPRVMQALVVLAKAQGSIVTRDELIERCWDGRIVSDDSINRVLSRIRQLASQIGHDSFTLETITKVGYRLVDGSSDGAVAAPLAGALANDIPGLVGRRGLMAGAAAVAAAAVTGGLLVKRPWIHRPSAEVQELFRRGDMAQRAGYADQARQSVTYFERAVDIDPLYAKAWGALALAYTHNLEGYGEAELASMPPRIRSAAKRALDLDPDNPDAQLALACTPPFFRNWAQSERAMRDLCERFPDHWLSHGRLAMLLYDVGRLEEGAELHKRVIEIDAMIPLPYAFAARALSNSGRIQEADAMLRQARERWPAHPLVWSAQFDHLLYSGRPKAAAAFLADPDALPSGFGPTVVEGRSVLARAVAAHDPADIEATAEHFLVLAREDTASLIWAAPVLSLLGRHDMLFESLGRYYFNRGPFGAAAPVGRFTRRHTSPLFTTAMASARADPRFAPLLRETGLESYWRGTRTVPDFRRA